MDAGLLRFLPPIFVYIRVFPCIFPCYRDLAFGDWFVSDCTHHHPVLANRAFPTQRQIGRFCADFRPLISRIWVSPSVGVAWWRFLAPCLRIQKFRSPAAGLEREVRPHCARKLAFCAAVVRDLWVAPQLFRIEAERLKGLCGRSRILVRIFDALSLPGPLYNPEFRLLGYRTSGPWAGAAAIPD